MNLNSRILNLKVEANTETGLVGPSQKLTGLLSILLPSERAAEIQAGDFKGMSLEKIGSGSNYDEPFSHWGRFVMVKKRLMDLQRDLLGDPRVAAGRAAWLADPTRNGILQQHLMEFKSEIFINALEYFAKAGLLLPTDSGVIIDPDAQGYRETLEDIYQSFDPGNQDVREPTQVFSNIARALVADMLNLRSKHARNEIIADNRLLLMFSDSQFIKEYLQQLEESFNQIYASELSRGALKGQIRDFVSDIRNVITFLQKDYQVMWEVLRSKFEVIVQWASWAEKISNDAVEGYGMESRLIHPHAVSTLAERIRDNYESFDLQRLGQIIPDALALEEVVQDANNPLRGLITPFPFLSFIDHHTEPQKQLDSRYQKLPDPSVKISPRGLVRVQNYFEKFNGSMSLEVFTDFINLAAAVSPEGTVNALEIKAIFPTADVSKLIHLIKMLIRDLKRQKRKGNKRGQFYNQAQDSYINFLQTLANRFNVRELEIDRNFTQILDNFYYFAQLIPQMPSIAMFASAVDLNEFTVMQQNDPVFAKRFKTAQNRLNLTVEEILQGFENLLRQVKARLRYYLQSPYITEDEKKKILQKLKYLDENIDNAFSYGPLYSIQEKETFENLMQKILKYNGFDTTRAVALGFERKLLLEDIFRKLLKPLSAEVIPEKLINGKGTLPYIKIDISPDGRNVYLTSEYAHNRIDVSELIYRRYDFTVRQEITEILRRMMRQALMTHMIEPGESLYIIPEVHAQEQGLGFYASTILDTEGKQRSAKTAGFFNLPAAVTFFTYHDRNKKLSEKPGYPKGSDHELNSDFLTRDEEASLLNRVMRLLSDYTDRIRDDLKVENWKTVTANRELSMNTNSFTSNEIYAWEDFQHDFTSVYAPNHSPRQLLRVETLSSFFLFRRFINKYALPDFENLANFESAAVSATQRRVDRFNEMRKNYGVLESIGSSISDAIQLNTGRFRKRTPIKELPVQKALEYSESKPKLSKSVPTSFISLILEREHSHFLTDVEAKLPIFSLDFEKLEKTLLDPHDPTRIVDQGSFEIRLPAGAKYSKGFEIAFKRSLSAEEDPSIYSFKRSTHIAMDTQVGSSMRLEDLKKIWQEPRPSEDGVGLKWQLVQIEPVFGALKTIALKIDVKRSDNGYYLKISNRLGYLESLWHASHVVFVAKNSTSVPKLPFRSGHDIYIEVNLRSASKGLSEATLNQMKALKEAEKKAKSALAEIEISPRKKKKVSKNPRKKKPR